MLASDEALGFAQFRACGSSTVGAVLDGLGLDGLIVGIRPATPGLRFAGPAYTIQLETGERGSFRPEDFDIAAYIDEPPPGSVVAIAAGGAAISTMGGIAVRVAQRRGIAAIVIDGGARDLDEIVATGFPLFLRHAVPVTGRTRVRLVASEGAVTIGGVTVEADDILVGDGTGIVRVPRRSAATVLEKALAIEERDRRARREVEKGVGFAEAFRRANRRSEPAQRTPRK